jgi:hypothetical protein
MTPSPNRVVALVLGAGFAVFGIASIWVGAATGVVIGAGPALLLGLFSTNVLWGCVLTAAGIVSVAAAARGVAAAKVANIVAGTLWLAIGYAGLFAIGTAANVPGINSPVTVGLFAASAVQLAVGLGARRDVPAPA